MLLGTCVTCSLLEISCEDHFLVTYGGVDFIIVCNTAYRKHIVTHLKHVVASLDGLVISSGIQTSPSLHSYGSGLGNTAEIRSGIFPNLREVFGSLSVLADYELVALFLCRTCLGSFVRTIHVVFADSKNHSTVSDDQFLIGECTEEANFRLSNLYLFRVQFVSTAIADVVEEFVKLTDVSVHSRPITAVIGIYRNIVRIIKGLVYLSLVAPPRIFEEFGHTVIHNISVRDVGIGIQDSVKSLNIIVHISNRCVCDRLTVPSRRLQVQDPVAGSQSRSAGYKSYNSISKYLFHFSFPPLE